MEATTRITGIIGIRTIRTIRTIRIIRIIRTIGIRITRIIGTRVVITAITVMATAASNQNPLEQGRCGPDRAKRSLSARCRSTAAPNDRKTCQGSSLRTWSRGGLSACLLRKEEAK